MTYPMQKMQTENGKWKMEGGKLVENKKWKVESEILVPVSVFHFPF